MNNSTRQTRKMIGNGLITLSFLILIFIYYPIIQLYWFSPKSSAQELRKVPFSIEIPKIDIATKVSENVDPYNQEQYRKVLEKGVAHAKGTAIPGEKGTVFLFAHSSDLPWRITRYNIPFFKLGELDKEDQIIIKKDGKRYLYIVYDKKIVWPTEVKYLKDTREDKLILQTCTPIGTDFQRLLIFAREKK